MHFDDKNGIVITLLGAEKIYLPEIIKQFEMFYPLPLTIILLQTFPHNR